MRFGVSLPAALLGLLALDCGGEAATSPNLPIDDVVGDWCQKQGDPACAGDEAMWLELRAEAGKLSGQMCDSPGEDCNALTSAVIEGNQLIFSYIFGASIDYPPPPALPDGGVGEAGPPTIDPGDRVDGRFAVQGPTMSGTLFSTKCACTMTITFYKQ
jgi:hypothetical protein